VESQARGGIPGGAGGARPPRWVIVDFEGAHFDPAQPSSLERILEDANIDAADVEWAAALRIRLTAAVHLPRQSLAGGEAAAREHRCRCRRGASGTSCGARSTAGAAGSASSPWPSSPAATPIRASS